MHSFIFRTKDIMPFGAYRLQALLGLTLVMVLPTHQLYIKTGEDISAATTDNYTSPTAGVLFNTAYRKPVRLEIGESCPERFFAVLPANAYLNGNITKSSPYMNIPFSVPCPASKCRNDGSNSRSLEVTPPNSRDHLENGQNVVMTGSTNSAYILTISFNRCSVLI